MQSMAVAEITKRHNEEGIWFGVGLDLVLGYVNITGMVFDKDYQVKSCIRCASHIATMFKQLNKQVNSVNKK